MFGLSYNEILYYSEPNYKACVLATVVAVFSLLLEIITVDHMCMLISLFDIMQ